MKQGLLIGLGIALGLMAVAILRRLLVMVLARLVCWLERREEAHMTPEQRVAKKCRQMAEALRKQR